MERIWLTFPDSVTPLKICTTKPVQITVSVHESCRCSMTPYPEINRVLYSVWWYETIWRTRTVSHNNFSHWSLLVFQQFTLFTLLCIFVLHCSVCMAQTWHLRSGRVCQHSVFKACDKGFFSLVSGWMWGNGWEKDYLYESCYDWNLNLHYWRRAIGISYDGNIVEYTSQRKLKKDIYIFCFRPVMVPLQPFNKFHNEN